MQIPVKIRSIRTRGKRRVTSIFFPSNFPLVAPTYDILSKDRFKVFHSNKALLCVYFYAYISLAYLEILSSRRLNFSHPRESSRTVPWWNLSTTRGTWQQPTLQFILIFTFCVSYHCPFRMAAHYSHRQEISHCVAQSPTDCRRILLLSR